MTDSRTAQLPADDVPTVIFRYVSEFEAAADVAALESIGITTHLAGSFSSDALNYAGLAARNVELLVPSKDAERAVRFLKEKSAAPRLRSSDWTCSDCGEVNGAEFDTCWSCNKTWSSDDREYEPSVLSQPFSPDAVSTFELPPPSDNPYAPPVAGTVVQTTSGDAMEEIIRRTSRGTILSLAFPPLLIVVVLLALKGLVNAGSGAIPCSRSQFRRLLLAIGLAVVGGMIAASMLLLI